MKPSISLRTARVAMTLAITCLVCTGSPVVAGEATRTVNERVPAEPKGSVEVTNISGKVTLAAWDRAEVAVSGTIGSKVEKVEVSGSGGRTTVRVVLPSAMFSSGNQQWANLTIYVPRESSATVSVVSADLVVSGVRGFESLRSVSGNIIGEVGGETKVKSVSGDIELEAPGNQALDAQTVSGNIRLHSATDQLRASSVSGDAKLTLGTFSRAHLETVSGDLKLVGALANGGGIEGQTISGDLRIDLAGAPSGSYDLRTLSGDISNCFGPKPVRPQYGPGARATFREGEGSARVELETQSGSIHLCNQAVLPAAPQPTTLLPQAPETRVRQMAIVW